jgi:hypothetical protein
LATLSKPASEKLNQEKLRRLENSPGRKSSISRMASSVVDVFKGSSIKNYADTEKDERLSVNNDD